MLAGQKKNQEQIMLIILFCTIVVLCIIAYKHIKKKLFSAGMVPLIQKIHSLDKLINQKEGILAYSDQWHILAWWHSHWQTWIRSLPT